jgi:uncharacterized protein YciI
MRIRAILCSLFLAVLVSMAMPVSSPAASATAAQISQLYIVIYRPGPGWKQGVPMREQGLAPHGRYMTELLAGGKLYAGGGFGDSEGGMMIVRASGPDEAKAIVAADPAVTSGIFVGHIERWVPRFRAAEPLPLPVRANAQAEAAARPDGARDFDWNIGRWKTHLRRLKGALTGSTTWVEYNGTSVVHGFLGNRANLVELSVEGPAGKIEGLLLRLYNPETRQWSMHFANVAAGELTPSLVGGFKDGRGEFYADDTLNGRPIKVRFVISEVTRNSARFEQAFSGDGGKTWEVNWIATDTRE